MGHGMIVGVVVGALSGLIPGAVSQETPTLVRFVDLDADGKLDRISCDGSGCVKVALNRGNRQFADVGQELPRVFVQSILDTDLNADGRVDLYLVASGAKVALIGDGLGRFTDATKELGLEDSGFGKSAERQDLDGDGLADLLLHNVSGDVVFWATRVGHYERSVETPEGDPSVATPEAIASILDGMIGRGPSTDLNTNDVRIDVETRPDGRLTYRIRPNPERETRDPRHAGRTPGDRRGENVGSAFDGADATATESTTGSKDGKSANKKPGQDDPSGSDENETKSTAAPSWSLGGNTNLFPYDFLGTLDFSPLSIRTNGENRLSVAAGGDTSVLGDRLIVRGQTQVLGLTKSGADLPDVNGPDPNVTALAVSGGAFVKKGLRVDGNVNFKGSLDVGENLNVGKNVSVGQAVTIGGATLINGKLTTKSGASMTGLIEQSGDMEIRGQVSIAKPAIAGQLTPTFDTHLTGDNVTTPKINATNLDVSNLTKLNALNVSGFSYFGTSVSPVISQHYGEMIIKGSGSEVVATIEGRSWMKGDYDGAQDPTKPEKHTALITGKKAGLAISIDGADKNSEESYVSFFNNGKQKRGQIAPSQAGDFTNSGEFGWSTAIYVISEVGTVGDLIIDITDWRASLSVVPGAVTPGPGKAIYAAVKAVAYTVAMTGAYTAYTIDGKKTGVTYETNSGDFAEWMPRKSSEDQLTFGQVVGVDGGEVSLQTDGAAHVMVISRAPAVLGNMPPDGLAAERCEKVAFIGQVPVWVKGEVSVGDYLVASGNNDGFAIAIHPNLLSVQHLTRIVGRAWSSAPESRIPSLVNTVVGIDVNASALILNAQEERIRRLETELRATTAKDIDDAVFSGPLGFEEVSSTER